MQTLRDRARALFLAGVAAADPAAAVRRALAEQPVRHPGGELQIISIGKAARKMAAAAMAAVPAPCRVLVVTNYENAAALKGAKVLAAGHPVPDENGAAAAAEVIRRLDAAGEGDRVLALISGGGSALLPAPVPGISLAEKAEVSRLLLSSGTDITEMNLVRQQLSRLKGGGFLHLAAPATVRALILSDVVGDDLRTIASGLTTAPLGSPAAARRILENRAIWPQLPDSVRRHLSAPAPQFPVCSPAENELIGSNRQSLAAMAGKAPAARMFPDPLIGDVDAACKRIIDFADHDDGVFLFGGETTVTLRGNGKGGRNQELALRMAMAARQADWSGKWVFLSGGTDGRDGPTDAAGGLVDSGSLGRILAAGIDPQQILAENDSYRALQAANDLLMTGATGTNVADLQVLIRGGDG